MQANKRELKKKTDDMSAWYADVVQKAEIADYAPVKGTMVIRPYGFALWQRVQDIMNDWMHDAEVENAYFPLFIPYSLLEKEKAHVEGFSPELAVVTHGGGEKLADPLVVRPTSETIMYDMYSKWISSWRDLPLKINQWNNVVRWEKRTYLFLRTMEFLWQEGHTVHVSEKEAEDMTLQALHWYTKLYEEYYALPVVVGRKSETEKFAGALRTYTIEALLPDGKALQGATSHNLGQNFSKVFEIQYQDKEGTRQYAWQTSWGLSTRSLGGLFLVHGDDDGLILPPKIATYQVVIVPIVRNDTDLTALQNYCDSLLDTLRNGGIRVKVDFNDTQHAGRRFNHWELKGVPLRYEIGAKEVEQRSITIARRDTKEKISVEKTHMLVQTQKILDEIQKGLYEKAKTFLTSNTHQVTSFSEFTKIMETTKGFIDAYWCEDSACEKQIKEKTKATTRCRPLNQEESSGTCIHCGKPATYRWYFGQSY